MVIFYFYSIFYLQYLHRTRANMSMRVLKFLVRFQSACSVYLIAVPLHQVEYAISLIVCEKQHQPVL